LKGESPILEEVLSHILFCQSKAAMFHGRENILQEIRHYLSLSLPPSKEGEREGEEEERGPFILYGESGCGKTSVMAKIILEACQDPSSPIVIARFLGTTTESSTLPKLLRSLCLQLCLVLSVPSDNLPHLGVDELVEFLDGTLSVAMEKEDRPFFIFLDSLDQLSPDSRAHEMTWIPRKLPSNVFMVLSTLPREGNCLENLKRRFDEKILPKAWFRELLSLEPSEALEIFSSWIAQEKKAVTKEQQNLVEKALLSCSLPLYLRLVFNEAKGWKSSTKAEEITLPPSIPEMIEQLFAKIEERHGRTLVQKAFGLITSSKFGLSENELEDLLSLDDAVLSDIFQYWLPPMRRLPPLLWTRVRADVGEYLSERDSDGSLVVFWYHRQFWEAAKKRYLDNGEDPLFPAKSFHNHLSEYFQGIWAGRPKPFEFTPRQMKFFGLKESKGEADRNVNPQPLTFAQGFSLPLVFLFTLLLHFF